MILFIFFRLDAVGFLPFLFLEQYPTSNCCAKAVINAFMDFVSSFIMGLALASTNVFVIAMSKTIQKKYFLTTLQPNMIIFPQLVIPIYSSHVFVIGSNTMWARKGFSKTILQFSLYLIKRITLATGRTISYWFGSCHTETVRLVSKVQ